MIDIIIKKRVIMATSDLIASIGKKIKHYRTLHKISLSSLAKEANVSKSTLFSLELGDTNPTIATLESIAKALNIDISKLIDSHQKEQIALLKNLSYSNSSLYQLKLAPFESFSTSYPTNRSFALELIDGSLTICSNNTHLHTGESILLSNNQELIAGPKGASALLKVVDEDTPLLLKSDTFLQSNQELNLTNIAIKALSEKVIRLLSNKELTIQEPSNIPYISSTQIEDSSLTKIYFFARYLGFKETIYEKRSLLEESDFHNLIEFMEKIINNEALNLEYSKNLKSNPFINFHKLIKESLTKKYQNLTTITLQEILTQKYEKKRVYLLTTELLDNSKNLKRETFTLNISRALEEMVHIDKRDLPNELFECYRSINQKLPEILYYALHNHITLAYRLTKELLESIDPFITEKFSKNIPFSLFYFELYSLLQGTVAMYESEETYQSKSTFETILKDLRVTIHLSSPLFPAITGGGSYLYLLEF